MFKNWAEPMWENNTGKSWYLTRDDKAVPEGHADATSEALVGTEGAITLARAEKYGLTKQPKAKAEEGSTPEPAPAEESQQSTESVTSSVQSQEEGPTMPRPLNAPQGGKK